MILNWTCGKWISRPSTMKFQWLTNPPRRFWTERMQNNQANRGYRRENPPKRTHFINNGLLHLLSVSMLQHSLSLFSVVVVVVVLCLFVLFCFVLFCFFYLTLSWLSLFFHWLVVSWCDIIPWEGVRHLSKLAPHHSQHDLAWVGGNTRKQKITFLVIVVRIEK